MLYWIFDLDHTLYTLDKNAGFSYSMLEKNSQLNAQLKVLPLKKIIFHKWNKRTRGKGIKKKVSITTSTVIYM